MGGMGSGRHWHYGAKDTTGDHRSIDVRRWHRDGLLTPQSFSWSWSCNGEAIGYINVRTEQDQVILTYRHRRGDEDWQDKTYSVWLNWTPCHFGGKRPWFLCPAANCNRRVAILYSGGVFACRHCYQLAYSSQRETYYDRVARQADKIRKRLGWEQGIMNPKGWQKPKGMHWRTFERLNKEHDAFADRSLTGIALHFNLIN